MQSREELLQALESVSHGERMARMIATGRRARDAGPAAAVLKQMAEGGGYERRLAAQACRGSGDCEHVLRALADPSALVVGLATDAVAAVCDDAHARDALDAATADVRKAVVVGLVKRGRHAVVDAFIDAEAARAAGDLVPLLPYGSAATVARHLERFADVADQPDWSRLAHHHPNDAAAVLERRAAAADRLDARVLWQARTVLPVLAHRRPDLALRLVRVLARHVPLRQLGVDQLARRRPDDVADLILANEDRATVNFERVVNRLEPSRLLALVRRRPDALGRTDVWLRRLSPARRPEVYEICRLGWRGRDGLIDTFVVALLPRAAREEEARRHFALPALSTRPAQRLAYASFLPWEEAASALAPFIGNPDAELRAAAVGAMVGCARFQPERLGDVLAFTLARRNEQDPVRRSAMEALAALPPGRWRAEHLDSLGQVIRQALDAADLSHMTASHAEQLVVNLLRFHPAWSAGWLATLARERGHVGLYDVQDRLNDDDVRRVAPDLLPVLQSWQTRERRQQLLSAAQSFGRRLRVFDGLADLLETLLFEPGEAWAAEQALRLLYEHRRDRIPRLIPELLKHDPSWATQPTIYNYLHHRAQHLLTPYLGRQAYKGRFSTGKTRFVLPLRDGFFRWTPAQQATFAQTLSELTRDAARDTPVVLTAVHQLSALPDLLPDRLVSLADARNPKLAVRDAALRGLGRLDAGRGVPVLITALQDDRARVAVYALRGALLAMPPERALAVLRGVPTDKVTVAKEVVRLLGEVGTDDAYADLLAMDDGRAKLHRDVRVALLRALWRWLDRPLTWPRLYAAAEDPDPAVAAGVVRVPAARLGPEDQRRLAGLLAKLLEHPDAKLRLDTLQRAAQIPVSDRDRVLMPGLLRSLGSDAPDESAAAASAVFATYAGREAGRVGEAVRGLLPNRRAVRTAVTSLESAVLTDRTHLLPTARAVLKTLATDPLTATLRAGFAVRALPPNELAETMAALAASGALHADALAAATAAVAQVAAGSDHERWDELARRLAADADERLRRLALAALVAAAGGASRGWDEARLAALESFRADPSPLVAGAAQFTFPNEPEEDLDWT